MTNKITHIITLFLILFTTIQAWAGVSFDQIKDGGVYTICNYVSNGNARNYISYDGTNTLYGAIGDGKKGYWIAHKLSGNNFYFESNQTPGTYLSGKDVSGKTATISVASGCVFTLSEGTANSSNYVSMYTAISSNTADKYMAGYADGHAFGIGCYAGAKNQYGNSWSTDWEFTEVGYDKQYFKDKVNFYNTNFNKLYSDDAKATALSAIDASSTFEDIYAALDDFCRSAEGKTFLMSSGSYGKRYIQQTTNTSISFTESVTPQCKFTLLYAGDGAYYIKSDTGNNWYWGYLNVRGGAFGGTGDTQWAGKWMIGKANAPNASGDHTLLFCWNSNVIYNYLHAANASLLTDWNDTDASKWTLEVVEETNWTVNITGGMETDRVLFEENEYRNGDVIASETLEPASVKTNIYNRFVWGPIIDEENHTVTFEVRSTQENSITAGKFYQLQMREKNGQWYDNAIKSGNMVDGVNNCTSPSVRCKGSQIYFMNARSAGYPLELTGVVPESEIYYSYVYVPTVSGNNVHIQSQNGSYVHNNGSASNSPINISFAYDGTNKTFKWPGKVGPWSWTSTANWVTIGMSSSFTDANYNIELFFHPVTTGEDYDIYKVMTVGEIECNSSALVTTITNAGGKFFFVEKNTAVTAADFTINGSEPMSISTNENKGYIELTLTERPHDVHEISSLASITDMYGYYKLTADVGFTERIAGEFHGQLDGNYHKITGQTEALFETINGAHIKNLILDDVSISGATVGAIANEATGNSRIYNCGVLSSNNSTITGSVAAGSIVGRITGNARVVNCYSYANVSGGTVGGGGIVGDWAGTWYNGSTGLMVANCMYYGDLTGTNRSPIVYGGSDINGNYSIYSYFRWKSMSNTNFTRQNGALAIQEDMWLERFKFFQAGVTNHRDIAAYYVFGDAARINEMGQWYIDETIAPWPILREAVAQKSILNRTVNESPNAEPNTGALITAVKNDVTGRYDKMPGTNGKLSVTFNVNNRSYTLDLPITDMDDTHYDYTWGKVVLPFANEFEGWTMPTSSQDKCGKICIGWKVTSVTGGNAGSNNDYDFSNRDNTNKDLYSQSHYVFAQGGNYIVPYGVTAITVDAHFADAYYLADATYDCATGGSNAHGGSRPATYNGKTLYTTVASAWAAMSDNTMPHDQAIVLVGNYHYKDNVSYNHTAKGCTIMSIDEDGDQQPDYGWYSSVSNARMSWPAIRWDFITIPSFGMLQIGANVPGLNIPSASGWFEITETALCRTFEFEISDSRMTRTLDVASGTNAYIIKGGWFQQLVRCYTEYGSSTNDKLSYVNIGGNAYIKEFFHGNHSNRTDTYTLRPINVTGGEIEQCFMTGMRNSNYVIANNPNQPNNVRFYCSGGKIGKYLSVYQAYPVVDATMKVEHARIGRFFGGGTTPKAVLTGNINITMNYSDVDFFCGGPEFGDMTEGKTVTISSTGSTFGEYYGAGFGGTALTRTRFGEGNNTASLDNHASVRLGYNADGGGFAVSYEMEALVNYQGNALYRFYNNRAALSKATTGSVTTIADNCLFKNNFFGGGCQGKVSGNVISTLNNCTVNGSAYGGGYKAAATTIDVYPASGHIWQQWDATYKAFTAPYYPQPDVYTWANGTAGTIDEANHILYTSEDLSDLGSVTGNTSLTITGAESVVAGDVFGGGAESRVDGNSTVVIGTAPAEHVSTQSIQGNVYGGGQVATIGGNTTVMIHDGHFSKNIFGGGEGQLNGDGTVKASADITGSTTVHVDGGEFSVALNTNDATKEERPFLEHYNIYGGGNLACRVGDQTFVTLRKGMLSANSDGSGQFLESGTGAMDLAYEKEGKMYFCVFGGGYGKNTTINGDSHVDLNIDYEGCQDVTTVGLTDDMLPYQSVLDVVGGGFNGNVQGNTYLHVGGDAMCRNLYGGGLYATIGGKTNVDVTGGNIDNVYGGGVMGDITNGTNVTIGLHQDKVISENLRYTKNNDKITILGSVYGGNDISGHVTTATITHLGGTIQQNIYGAGNGNYQGYYTPNKCAFNDGENDNYFNVIHPDDDANSGRTYKGRPQTDNVNITFHGLADNDKATVLGQVFGGGNSCTVGLWDATLLTTTHHGNPHESRDDPDYFLGGGSVSINIKSHVKIGRTNAQLDAVDPDTRELYTDADENVSGLFMGCSGKDLATQTTNPTDYTYHHYYDAQTKKYWQGFAVYDGSVPMTCAQGQQAFNAYLNNILIWSNDVSLNIDNNATDVWLANFIAGGFRGSMKAKTTSKQYAWTIPSGVTVGYNLIGGAYNTDVVYRIYKTTDNHNYDVTDGHYHYLTEVGTMQSIAEDPVNGDYDHVETDPQGNITGIVRFMYAGGILTSDGSNKTDLVTLDLRNNMNGGEKSRVFGGCFASGIIQGDTKINYRATGAYDVYGGGALANIAGNTKVNLLGGSLTNAYGGGLGRKQDVNNTAVAALVNGNATVIVNGAAVQNVFGGNNVNGTPKGQTLVHVMGTTKRSGQGDEAYHIDNVYGGGNNAAYEPTDAENTNAQVVIEGCESSIANVYGGGNAAAVPGTDVTIFGGRIENAFGGGNGQGDGNPGADVGYLRYYSITGNVPENYYGPGTSQLTIYGGTIDNAFGGSNTLGYIRTSAAVNIDEAPDELKEKCCELLVKNVHGGGNKAPMYCNGSVTLNCTDGIDVIYAGSNNADIHGDIDLNITSGTYKQVFGGNNTGGNIYGHIRVNIDETGCWPIMIGELYGCGNEAPYSVYGYDGEGHCITSGERQYDDPTINIISASKVGTIYGGGKGEGAAVYGNPLVNVNMIKGRWAGQTVGEGMMMLTKDNEGQFIRRRATDAERNIPNAVGSIENIFGGGDAAVVVGNTYVNIGTAATAKHLTPAEAELETVGVNITDDVFGGGNKGNVTGSTNVKVGR